MSAIHLPSSDFPARRANMEYVCTGCGSRHGVDELLYTCPECGGVLLLEDLDFDALAYKKVYYDITGKELRTKEDLEKARIIHAISKNSNINFSNVPTEYYLDYKFYNSVLDAIKRRFYDLADELGNNAADPNYRKLYSKFNATLHLVQQAREDSKKALVDNERVIKGV